MSRVDTGNSVTGGRVSYSESATSCHKCDVIRSVGACNYCSSTDTPSAPVCHARLSVTGPP